MGKWKGVQYKVSLEQPDAIELFDLEKDPYEQTNLATRYPEVVKGIKAVLENEHRYNKEWPLLYKELSGAK
jgi:arylsulfatase A-like enzyme